MSRQDLRSTTLRARPAGAATEQFFDDAFQASTGDGSVDCQPEVYARCADDEVRDQAGECTDPSDCSAQCPDGGTYVTRMGVCECDNMPTLSEVRSSGGVRGSL